MRIAFVDPMFTWPPPGGAPVDLAYAMRGLQQAGHEVRLYLPEIDRWWGRRNVERMPVPAALVACSSEGPRRRDIGRAFRAAVEAFSPDAVHLGFSFFLKPYLAEGLEKYPIVLHYYAYELTCPRDYRIYRDGKTCPANYLRTPEVCRRCTYEGLAVSIRHGEPTPYVAEYLDARAYTPAYYRAVLRMLALARIVVVNSPIEAERLAGLHPDVRLIPPGVDLAGFPARPMPVSGGDGVRRIVLMAGRAEDPAKGVEVLRDAAVRLAAERDDFEIRVTWRHEERDTPWFRAIGWHSGASLQQRYAESHICVTPSLWDEPFGLVAAEAMATGRPVVASRVGGLASLVDHGATGLLFDRGDVEGLRAHLSRLLDDAALCERMGTAGRERVESTYAWPRIIEDHYLPLFEDATR